MWLYALIYPKLEDYERRFEQAYKRAESDWEKIKEFFSAKGSTECVKLWESKKPPEDYKEKARQKHKRAIEIWEEASTFLDRLMDGVRSGEEGLAITSYHLCEIIGVLSNKLKGNRHNGQNICGDNEEQIAKNEGIREIMLTIINYVYTPENRVYFKDVILKDSKDLFKRATDHCVREKVHTFDHFVILPLTSESDINISKVYSTNRIHIEKIIRDLCPSVQYENPLENLGVEDTRG